MAGLNFNVPWYLTDAVDYLLNGGPMHDGWWTGPLDKLGQSVLDQLRRSIRQHQIQTHDNFIVRYLSDGSLQQQGPLPHVWPEDLIPWAIKMGIPVCSECTDFNKLLSNLSKRGAKGGPKDETLYRVIAGLALANGYKRNSKNAQGWMSTITDQSAGLDPKTIKSVIDAALDALDEFKTRER